VKRERERGRERERERERESNVGTTDLVERLKKASDSFRAFIVSSSG